MLHNMLFMTLYKSVNQAKQYPTVFSFQYLLLILH